MGRIVIKDGIKWDYDFRMNCYTFIEKIEEEEIPKKKTHKKRKDAD